MMGKTMNWIEWSRWFDTAADDANLAPIAHTIMVHIAGWADNVGTGWAIDPGCIADWAKRYSMSEAEITHALKSLESRRYVDLTMHDAERNLRTGRVLFDVGRQSIKPAA
jgi:hypothetical protein